MIDKQQAELLGINAIDMNNQCNDDKLAIINKIKELLPNIINSDNQLDTKALNDLLGVANSTSNNQGYELTFAGKGLARAKADAPTNKELKIELEQSKNFDKTQNVVIRGDNIDVLKVLYKNYHKQIKMIYIDPPYNTKSENFVYNDNFKVSEAELCEEFGLNEETTNFLTSVYGTRSHSGWLSFMYPRLKLARELLTDDGVIFISIDDNEQANLKIICDEIFGADNFIAQIMVIVKTEGRQYGNFAKTHEYVLVYAKSIESLDLNKIKVSKGEFRYFDYQGGFNTIGLRNRAVRIFNSTNRPNLRYPFYVSANQMDENGFFQVSVEKNDGWVEVFPSTVDGLESVWRWGKETARKNISDLVALKGNDNEIRIFKKDRELTTMPKTIWFEKEFNSIVGTREITNLFGGVYFDFPKPVKLLQQLLYIGSNDNDIILDFFAGSGTTGDAVMQLNAEDGGNRKFILVQWDEKIAEYKEAYKFCTENKLEPVISSITIERINRAGEKIKAEQETKNPDLLANDTTNELDIGYKVFSLVDKPKIDYQNDALSIVNSRVGALNTLYNMLVATCKPLDIKIEEIIPDVLYKAANEIYVVGNIDVDTLSKYRDLKVNIDAFVDISLESYLNLGLLDKDNVYMIYS